MGVFESRGSYYSTLNSRILIIVIRSPKYGTPNFRKLPNVSGPSGKGFASEAAISDLALGGRAARRRSGKATDTAPSKRIYAPLKGSTGSFEGIFKGSFKGIYKGSVGA